MSHSGAFPRFMIGGASISATDRTAWWLETGHAAANADPPVTAPS
jgi:hypothetical protein